MTVLNLMARVREIQRQPRTLSFTRFRKWLAAVIRPHLVQDEPMLDLEFYGGPKDGDRETVGLERVEWVVSAMRQVVLSPWGLEEQPTDLVRIERVGTYTRSVRGMEWQG